MSKLIFLKMIFPLLLTLIFSPLFATGSLMFSQKEYSNILSKRAKDHLNQLKRKEDCLECNGLVFQDAKTWSVWLNGQKIDSASPHCHRQHLKVSKVENNKVHLEWDHKGKSHLITLSPNHYYNANTLQVITTGN